MAEFHPILVTGAGSGVGRMVTGKLSAHGVRVRAFVHHDDDRAQDLRAMDGVEVAVGDLTAAPDVMTALDGCRRAYFGMSVSPYYLEAATTMAAAALSSGSMELLVNMSQMTVSQMDLTSSSESRQQRQHWLAEHVLNWSGLPVTHIRPTVFMENPLFSVIAATSIQRDGTIRLPFGRARTSPVAERDVVDVVTHVLGEPARHAGRVYELTGAASRDMTAIAAEFTEILHRPVVYEEVPFDSWVEHDLKPLGLSSHLFDHIKTMAKLHRENRYDRVTSDIAELLGRPPVGFESLVDETPSLQEAAG